MQSKEPTPMPSSDEPSAQTSPQVIDLSAIAARHPVHERTMVLDLATLDVAALTLLEVVEMSGVAGIAPGELAGVLKSRGMTPEKARVLYALAWTIVRREFPEAKFSEVITWKLDVRGKVETEVSTQTMAKAKATVAAAKLAGVTPREAESLTVAELAEYARTRPRGRAPRGRKR